MIDKEKIKVGIITYHRSLNYGAFLQAYSLCMRLNSEEGIEAEIIDFQMKKEVEHYSARFSLLTLIHPIRLCHDIDTKQKQKELFTQSLSVLPLSKPHVISDSIDDFQKYVFGKYDVIVAGSDEIWKTNGFRGFPTPYWLFGELNCRKMSYAASARNDFSFLSEKDKKLIHNSLEQYEYIGVRDALTKSEIQKTCLYKVEAHLCCDPTFLWDFIGDEARGRKILAEKFKIKPNKKVLGIMTESPKAASILSNSINKKDCQVISLYQWHSGCVDASGLSPFEWIDVLSTLDLFATSFFHGVCFAIKLGIPLLAFGTTGKSNKVKDVINMTGRESDYIDDLNDSTICLSDVINEKLSKRPAPFRATGDMLKGYQELIKAIKE